MSKVKIEGNASGTGTLTISAPNTNTDRALTLPDGAGEILTDASTLSSSNLSGALPAIDGSALTGITSGKILQIVEGTSTTETTTTSTSPVTANLSASITPSSTSSDILVMVTMQAYTYGSDSGTRGYYYLYRDDTSIWQRWFGVYISGTKYTPDDLSFSYLDSPSSTSSISYNMRMKSENTSTTTTSQYFGLQGQMLLLEIAGE